jgi:diguanylate cyclase (GGDEF)-like protein
MNLKVNPVNLKKYLLFFQQSTDCASALVLFSLDGGLNIMAQEGGDADGIENLTKHSDNDSFTNDDHTLSTQDLITCKTGGTWLKVALMLPHSEQPYWLAGQLKPNAHALDNAQRTKAINTLSNIADYIVEDYNLQLTLTGMTDELTVRYEELNLIYGLDDSEIHHKSFDEKQALSQLINNCTDYMNVDLAVLYAPGLDLLLQNLNPTHQDLDLTSTLKTIQDTLYSYLVSTEKTLVINQNRDADWTDPNLNNDNKILAAPIMLTKHHVIGILVLVNTPNKPDFSNSDRKLCDVLASEAAKIIQARRDNITGLVNRRGFTEVLQQALTDIKTASTKYSLLFIDIDQFKIINDTSGQKAGDQLLNHVSGIINKELSQHHVVGRLGADEYGVLLKHCDLNKAEQIADAISHSINQFRFAYQGKLFDISVCMGLVELIPGMDDFSVPLSAADMACNFAKGQGRNRIHTYHSSDNEMIRHESEMHWVSRIILALEEERFQIYRQKILPLKKEQTEEVHYEILLRLKDENGNLIPPFNFIPAAERYNLMSKLDRWVVKSTLAKMAAVLQQEPESKLSCSINLSGQSFTEPGFAEFIIEQINKSVVSTDRICFEITETAAVSNLSQTVKFMETLKNIGCTFSLDDFGSGMSSFTYLKNLPVDYLKIDGYFVKTMLANKIDYAMVKSINDIGHVMGLKTVAEFVENDQILQELTSLGIDYGQGYGIAKPEPFE